MIHTNSREFITHSNRTRVANTTNLARKFTFYRSILYRESFTSLKSLIRNTYSITSHEFYLIDSIRTLHASISKDAHRINLIQITYDNLSIIEPVFCKYKIERSSTCTSHICIISYLSTIFISSFHKRNISLSTTNYIPCVLIISIKLLSRKL